MEFMNGLAPLLLGLAAIFTPHLAAAADAQPRLGTGLDEESAFVRDVCIEGTLESFGGGEASLEALQAKNLRDAYESLEGRVTGGINLGLVGAEVSGDYLSRISSTDLRQSFEIGYQVRLPTQTLRNPRKHSSLEGLTLSSQSLRQRCGTGAVVTLVPGLRFRAALVLDFQDKQSYERFKRTIKVRVLWFSKSKTVVDEVKRQSGAFSAHFELLQEGGSQSAVRQLQTQLPTCTPANIEECIDALQTILDFLNAPVGRGGLRDQAINSLSQMGKDEGPIVLETRVVPYARLALAGSPLAVATDPQARAAGVRTRRLSLAAATAGTLIARAGVLASDRLQTTVNRNRLALLTQELTSLRDDLERRATACQTALSSESCLNTTTTALSDAQARLAQITKEIAP